MFEKQQKQLLQREQNNSERKLLVKSGLVDFSSNDYLALAQLNCSSLEAFNAGSTGSRLLNGNYPLMEQLEQELAVFHQGESALVFNSGYSANIGLFSSLPQKGDVVLYDELIHASIKDGVRLSFATGYSFKHNNLADLQKKIAKIKKDLVGTIYIAVEAVYSMDGDNAPLKKLVSISEQLNCVLIVDEAHAVGVYGEKGEGLTVELNLAIPIRVITFGKAIGNHGAAVVASQLVKKYLVNYARSFIYSTALPPKSVASVRSAYQLLQEGEQRERLKILIKYFKQQLNTFPKLNFIASTSAIHCLVLGSNQMAKECSSFLADKGFDVRPILSPTVSLTKERIRVCLHSFNTESEVQKLLLTLNEFLNAKK